VSNAHPCIVLAGGLGTRLRSLVADRPKCLAPVGRRSFLELQLDLLAAQGVDCFVLSLGHLAEQVVAEAQRMKGRHHIELVVEDQPLGTGGAVAHAMRTVGLSEALVTNGDTFLGGDLRAMLRPLGEDEDGRMAVLEVADRARYGGVQVRDGRVRGFVEKGHAGPGAINAGLYHLRARVFDAFEAGSPFSLEAAVLPALASSGRLGAVPIEGEFTDIGVPEDYLQFCVRHG
jgi:D-glycero-alpha-D-manno-heptose 1-phosphate guanylyltransferase